jgi:hypothetical protein
MRKLSFRAARLTALAVAAVSATTCGGGGADASTQPGGCRAVSAAMVPSSWTIAIGDSVTLQLVFNTTGTCFTTPAVTWTTDNSAAVSLTPDTRDDAIVYAKGRAAAAQPVTVTGTVTGVSGRAQITVTPGPSIKLTPQSLTFTAIQNQNTLPDSQVVHITNGGGGVLGHVGPDPNQPTVYGPGASNWLFIEKSALTSTAPYDLYLQPRFTNFAPGTYTATVHVTSLDAANSPQDISVTYTISAGGTAPSISNLAVALASLNSCSVGSATGSLFTVTFKFTDPAGNAFTGAINEQAVFRPSGGSASGSVRVPSAQATIANGAITTSVCIAFLGDTSVDFTLSLQSDFGQSSNSLTVNVPKPAGASWAGRGPSTFVP